jgi:hypothetical protein
LRGQLSIGRYLDHPNSWLGHVEMRIGLAVLLANVTVSGKVKRGKGSAQPSPFRTR